MQGLPMRGFVHGCSCLQLTALFDGKHFLPKGSVGQSETSRFWCCGTVHDAQCLTGRAPKGPIKRDPRRAEHATQT